LKSVISADVTVGDDAGISYSVVMPGAKIGKGAFVFKAVIGSNAIVEDYTVLINAKPDGVYLDNCQGISVVGNNASVYTNNGWLPDCAALPRPEAAVVI
jgi:ADP-glucose pyrophosphorylase